MHRTGDVIAGRFELVEHAGHGGMGTIFRAHDRELGGPVAVKLLHDPGSGEERFRREATTLANLRHPNVVRYIAHGSADGLSYLAMEWLEGENLADRLTGGPLAVDDALAVATQVALALAVAHERGVVHRDIKPANLFLVARDVHRLKVLDFGIARVRTPSFSATPTGRLVGTPGYMAPEQARSARDTGPRADLFALGCVLFECLTGRRAFQADNVLALLAKILLEDPPRASELRDGIPPEVQRLLSQLLAKAPEARPADGAALAQLLSELPLGAGPGPAPALAISAGEQELLSVVFVAPPPTRDGGLAEQTTQVAEEVPAEAVREIARRFGARSEHLASGSVVLVVRGAGAATDLAVRAARLALALRGAVGQGVIALATGRAQLSGGWPVGEVIDRATRLLRQRPPAQIVVDDLTAGLIAGRFELAGGEGMWHLVDERRDPASTRLLLGRPSPFVGREREMQALRSLWGECVHDSVAHAVLVTGAPGMGKSRLRHELECELAGERIWRGQADAMTSKSPLALLARVVRSACGVAPGEDDDAARATLGRAVADLVEPAQAAQVARGLGGLLGVAGGSTPDVAGAMFEQVRRAWEDFSAAACRRGPVLLVLDDLHWADAASIKALESTLRREHDRPLLVVAFARPEVQLTFPGLWEDRRLTTMKLGELGRRASEKLVTELLGADLSSDRLRAIVARAAGNAFYLEEIIRAVAGGEAGELPDTVLAMAQARFARLEPEQRRILRAASVFGEVFWPAGVAALLGGPVADEVLAELVDKEAVEPRAVSRFPASRELAFRHSLLRDAAYASLPESDRQAGHRLAARWLEQAGERDPALIAGHHEQGDDLPAAAPWYRRAAVRAVATAAFDTALAHAERAIAGGITGEPLGLLRALEAEIHMWRGQHLVAEERGRQATAAMRPDSVRWCYGFAMTFAAGFQVGHTERYTGDIAKVLAFEPPPGERRQFLAAVGYLPLAFGWAGLERELALLCARMDELAGQLDEADAAHVQPFLLLASGRAAYAGGRLAAALADTRRAAAMFRERLQIPMTWTAAHVAAECASGMGAHDEALALLAELPDLDPVNARSNTALVGAMQAVALADRGDLAGALATATREVEVAIDSRFIRAYAHWALAYVRWVRGDVDGAAALASSAAELASRAGPVRAVALAILGRAALAQGRPEVALGHAEEAAALVRAHGRPMVHPRLVELTLAESLAATGNAGAARELAQRCALTLRDEASALPDPARFLAVAEHAELLRLAPLPDPPPALRGEGVDA